MASLSGGLSPNIVKTALDDVFYQEANIQQHPQYATAETAAVFKQDTADSSAVIWELFKGGGLWSTRSEEQDVVSATPRVANQKTFTVTNFAQSIDITKNLFDDKFRLLSSLNWVNCWKTLNWAISSQAKVGIL